MWFEVRTADGRNYIYGENADARLTIDYNGQVETVSWYVSRIDEVNGDYMTYSYTSRNYYVYPSTIDYGMNVHQDRHFTNRVKFEYEELGNTPTRFVIGGNQGMIDRKLASVTTTHNNEIFRKYSFVYDTRDYSQNKYCRLIQIFEKNGKGEDKKPVRLTWAALPGNSMMVNNIGLQTSDNLSWIETQDRNFMAADLNGDGVSDIVRISPVKITDYTVSGGTGYHYETYVYISRSEVSTTGKVSFLSPLIYTLPASFSLDDMTSTLGGTSLMDFDGDGYNDLVLPYLNRVKGYYCETDFYVIRGSEVTNGSDGPAEVFAVSIADHGEIPLVVSCDIDKDGRDDVVYLERKSVNGSYCLGVIRSKEGDKKDLSRCNVSVPKTPKKIFTGDYDNDGLCDILVLYTGGYKIFYNAGGMEADRKYSDAHTFTGTSISDHWRYEQGDFNGDGLVDFVYNISKQYKLWIALNNGDGTFSVNEGPNIGVADQSDTQKDDSRFTIKVLDINRDGMSDVVVSKAMYSGNSFSRTDVVQLVSDGTTLIKSSSVTKKRADDAYEPHIFTGDFDGDGYVELANYGSNLLRNDDTFTDNTINIYSSSSGNVSSGKITRIRDAMDNDVSIIYAVATNPQVYTKSEKSEYPLNIYTLPLPVVRKVSVSNGVAGPQTIDYSYADYGIHMRGAGVLGFKKLERNNNTTGETVTTTRTRWDKSRLIPLETSIVNTTSGMVSTTVTTNTVKEAHGTYAVFETGSSITDIYGNTVTSSSVYDEDKGVLLSQKVQNDGDEMFKLVEYSGYQNKSGRNLPTVMTVTQKHVDDMSEYTTETRYEYDEIGNETSVTSNYGTSMALKSTYTYDVYGNTLTSELSGCNVKSSAISYIYDTTGRFVTKKIENLTGTTLAYSYDNFGNLLTECDFTTGSMKHLTTHGYDGWGRRVSTCYPDGTSSSIEIGWSGIWSDYYIYESATGKPWALTWFDSKGNVVKEERIGPDRQRITKSNEYNDKGLVERINLEIGKSTFSKTIDYDDLGRVIEERESTGKETIYVYGNRSVTTTESGHVTMSQTDAWGNVKKSTDATGGEVIYLYSSNGQPVAVTAGDTTVEMEYDVAGNRISMSDPDTGTTTYEYAADGKLLTQTDARGVVTSNEYDETGRLYKVTIGGSTIVNTYGDIGIERTWLLKKKMGDESIEYTYDNNGRVTSENKTISRTGSFTTRYSYDRAGYLSGIVYPGGLEATYKYDDFGYLRQILADGVSVYRLDSQDCDSIVYTFMDDIKTKVTYSKAGTFTGRTIYKNGNPIDGILTDFNVANGNLKSRSRLNGTQRRYGYDELDRLVHVWHDQEIISEIEYAPDGNIISKSDVGGYTYNGFKPHAVSEVENTSALISSESLLTAFNEFNMVESIEQEGDELYHMDFSYGPDLQRSRTVLTCDGEIVRETVYAGQYERITEGDTEREYYYVGENVIVVKNSGTYSHCLAMTDHLGSILSVVDEDGTKVFDAEYDEWGRQTVIRNDIGLQRGYTGHEMLPEFDIINMNGRLYDPVIGRFLGPDNYIQQPWNTQSYNRYSYCLNNPLKYNDPTGQLFGIDDAFIAFAFFNVAKSMMTASMNGENIWKAGALSLLSSATSFGIGQAFGACGSVGNEIVRAGAHGLSGGIFSVISGGGFGSGVASGVLSSGFGSLAGDMSLNSSLQLVGSSAVGGVSAWIGGGDFLMGAMQGLQIALFNHVYHIGHRVAKGRDKDGNMVGLIPQMVVVYEPGLGAMYVISTGITVVDSLGDSLEKNSQHSMMGSNGKLYFTPDDVRPFYGNQYVSTKGLKSIGTTVIKYTKPLNIIVNTCNILIVGYKDAMNWKTRGSSDFYNTTHAIGELAGAAAGAKLGAAIGASIGGLFGGVGAIPGSIIGGFIGGILGSSYGSQYGGKIVDSIYNY